MSDTLTDEQAIKFTNDIFALIKNTKTIQDIERIYVTMAISDKNRISTDNYPKIEFSINSKEVQSLIDCKLLDPNFNLTPEISSKLTDPLTKLLYAIAWKNGDLQKLKHIIKGIIDSEIEDNNNDKALVFYQFGKYLTKVPGQPIIDQHVIRAFATYKSKNLDQLKTIRKMQTISKSYKNTIQQYKEWLISAELTTELKKNSDYTYHIDKLLFATGKTIKTT